MTIAEFSNSIFTYEKSLDLPKRKSNGIFYTDLSLAKKIIDELSIPKDALVLDPCCGTGSFNYAAALGGIKNIYGSDIDEKAINLCRKNIVGVTFIKANSIELDSAQYLSKFSLQDGVDYVVGNPPYAKWNPSSRTSPAFVRQVSLSGSNLFVAGLIKAFEYAKEDGVVSYIIPKNFLHVSSYSLLRKKILNDMSIISIIDIGAYFKNVRGEQIILTVRKTKPNKNNFVIKKLLNDDFVQLTEVNQSFFEDEILLFSSETDVEIYKKLNKFSKLDSVCTGYIGRGRSIASTAITGKEIRKFGYKNTNIPTTGNQIFIQNIYSSESGIIAAFGGNLEAGQTVTILTDGDARMCNFVLGILHSKLCNFFLYRYCYNYSKLTMHTDAKYLKKIPLPDIDESLMSDVQAIVLSLQDEDYMGDNWFRCLARLDSIIFDAYKLSDAEKLFVEGEMNKIQSKKWSDNGVN